MLAALLCAAALPGLALAADAGFKVWGDQPASGVIEGRADTPLRLVLHVESGGAPASGREVNWRIEGQTGGTLSHEKSKTSAGGVDQPPVGEASVLFTARAPGDYVVLGSVDPQPECAGDGCPPDETVRFRVSVAGAAAASDSGGNGHGGLIAAVAGAGAAALILASQHGDDDESRVMSLTMVSGDGQSGAAGSSLSSPLVVQANNDGRPASDVSISWTASGGATLSDSSTSTDSSGHAQVSVTSLGPGPGPVTVTARRTDSSASVSFTITVLNKELAIVSGNGQSAPVNTTVPAPLVVEASVGPTPQSGIGITWAVVSGDASIASVSNGGNTDGSGQSSATVDLGPTPGPVVVSATRDDAAGVSVSFTLNSLLVRTLTIASGDNQTAAPNTPLPSPLVVNAQDNGANASGITINWFATGGATLSSPSSVTDGSGQASITVTSTGPGPEPFTVTAVRADDATAQVLFNENILPPTLGIAGGDNQSGLTGSTATAPLDVLLVDGGSVPVSGQTITWTVTSGSAILAGGTSVTDGTGHATMGFTYGGTPGPITIEASAYSGSQVVSFDATAVTASGLNKGGDNQSGDPGDALAPLVVTIVPPAGVTDLSGVPVTFTITSGTGSLSVTSTTTDASGQASTVLTLGLTPGTVTVEAQVTNGPSTTFTATINGSLVATNLQLVSGDGQTLDTGVASAPMVVELRDGGTPLAGMTVSWSSSNGTVNPTSSVTDVNGRASATVTPGASGPVIVTASFAAFAQYTASSVAFTHNTTLGSLSNLTTDEAAVAVALDNACGELSGDSGLSSEEQDLLDQCEAMAAASGSNPGSVAEAIEEILPDVAKTQTQTGEAAVDAQFDNLGSRISALRAGVRGVSLGGLTLSTPTGVVSLGSLAKALADGDPAKAADDSGFERWGFFASGNIGRGHTDSIDDAPGYEVDIRGLTAGVDYRFSDNLVAGVALGYTKQDTTLNGQQGSVGLRGFSISAYSTWYHAQSWYVDGALSLANNDFRHRRRIDYTLPGQDVDQMARASSDGRDASATLTFGRDFQRKEWTFGLYGRALYSHQSFDSFDEELDSALAGSGLALEIESRSVNSLSSVLGARASVAHSVSWGVVAPQFGLEWERDYSGDPDAFRAFLISDPTGTPILITGDALDDNYFRINIGVALLWTRGRSGFIQYDRVFAREDTTMENLTIGFRMEF